MALLFAVATAAHAQVITTRGNEAHSPGSWICFRNTFVINDKPEKAVLRIAADSKYWLWINGVQAVSEGGLKRGPNPTDTYCDVIKDIKGLRQGKNEVAVLVWYFGKDGFSHRNSPTPGMTFSLSDGGREAVRRQMAIYGASGILCSGRRRAQLQARRVEHRIRCGKRQRI